MPMYAIYTAVLQHCDERQAKFHNKLECKNTLTDWTVPSMSSNKTENVLVGDGARISGSVRACW